MGYHDVKRDFVLLDDSPRSNRANIPKHGMEGAGLPQEYYDSLDFGSKQ